MQGLFHSPKGSLVESFAQLQLHLYRHDPSLQDYFMMLHSETFAGPRASSRNRQSAKRYVEGAIYAADQVSRFYPRRKIKADVLFCPMPYFDRKTENQFMVRTLLAIAQTDATIVCLLPVGAPCRAELNVKLMAAGRAGQVTFVDIATPLNRVEARLRPKIARLRGRAAFGETVQILEPYALAPGLEVEGYFEHVAFFVESWERLAPWVEFDALVARCHWHVLCSAVCRTALDREKPVVTFQQGVITHTLEAPVTASKYVAFGPSSASFMARVNRAFSKAAGMPESPVEYISGGSLYDTISALPDQFDRQTLLMVDEPTDRGQSRFYSLESQSQALLDLAKRLLAAGPPLRRLIIRPHPFWSKLDFAACQCLVREHPDRCELSHPAWSLEDDLRRSSVVVGIFSGVLTVASACGLPTVFLQTEDGYATGDLACFSNQTLLPDAAFATISKVLSDRQAYAEAQTDAVRNAREYYANGTNLDLTGAFFERLLRTGPATNATGPN
ncbi:MAG TPA: hypothetical protein VMI10_00990 [Terriglobales bacterium]|nr:hypothetical protein [Terriglobales bacterium]